MSNTKRISVNLQDLLIHTKRNANNCLEWQGSKNIQNYPKIWLNSKYVSVHRIVAQLTISNIDNKPCVMHICDNPICINPDHLMWGTWAENNKDRHEKGRSVMPNNKGSKHGMAKINEETAQEIRSFDTSKYTQKQIASKYGISPSLVSAIRRGIRW